MLELNTKFEAFNKIVQGLAVCAKEMMSRDGPNSCRCRSRTNGKGPPFQDCCQLRCDGKEETDPPWDLEPRRTAPQLTSVNSIHGNRNLLPSLDTGDGSDRRSSTNFIPTDAQKTGHVAPCLAELFIVLDNVRGFATLAHTCRR